MNINRCAGFFVLFFLSTTKVKTGEASEEQDVPEQVEDISFRTHALQNIGSSTAAVPAQPVSPYPYNFYYPNPYALYSPHMYNYQSSPYFQSPQHSAEPSLQNIYSLNTAGYPFKVTQKFVTGEEHLQDNDLQIPSLMYTSFHNNRPYHPFEILSSDKNNLKQSLVPQPPTQSSFFQGQSISLANNTEMPAVNVNSISLQAYKWPSVAGEKPSVTKIIHTALPSISGGSFESTALPANLSLEKDTRNLIMDTVSYETTAQNNNSVNSQENQFLPLNSSIADATRSSEEMRSEINSGVLPNFSNEVIMNTSVSDSFKNEIISSNFNSIGDIKGHKHEQTGAVSSNAYLEKEISAAQDVLQGIRSQGEPGRESMDVLNGTATFESIKSGNGQSKQLFDTREDIPNTLIVQITTVHNDKSIEAPQVDPSGNIVLFPISGLMQNTKNIKSTPLQHHHQRYFSRSINAQNNDNKGNSTVKENRQEPMSVTNVKNHQLGRRNKILDVTAVNSKEIQKYTTLPILSTENESTKKQNKSPPVRTRNRNIIIWLPNGQKLVINVSHSRDTNNKTGSSGSKSGEVPLRGAPRGQPTQQTHSLENTLSEEIPLGGIGSEEEGVVNDIGSTTFGVIQEGEVQKTPFLITPEQNFNLSTFGNINSVDENSASTSLQDYIRTAKGFENTDVKHGSNDVASSSPIKPFPQRYSPPIPADGQQNNMDPIIHWSAIPTKADTENLPTSPLRNSNRKTEKVQNPRITTYS